MTLKKKVKIFGLQICKGLGLLTLARDSQWRSRRLLILAYHGFSLADEHLWFPELFLPASEFESRLAHLSRDGYTVLPLGLALQKLKDGGLPEKSVAITIDDGNYDFLAKALPLLKSYDYPATVYLTTYYCDRQKPLFNHICSYMLWKRRGELIPCPGLSESLQELDLRTSERRDRVLQSLVRTAEAQNWSAEQKDLFAKSLALALSLDYEDLVQKRLFQRMNAGEIGLIAAAGIDVQLHTHRHRTPEERGSFEAEIQENRSRIVQWTGNNPRHFCYPSGVYKPKFLPWLSEMGVVSATTCVPGLAAPGMNPLLLPRVLDGADVSPIEFASWASGLTSCLPRAGAKFLWH